jgi:hypothetical protein
VDKRAKECAQQVDEAFAISSFIIVVARENE